jgi:hypothetical protein
MPQGETCFNVDFSTLGMNLVNGSQVTIQVQYNGVSRSSVARLPPRSKEY